MKANVKAAKNATSEDASLPAAAMPVPAFSLLCTVCLIVSLAMQVSAQSGAAGTASGKAGASIGNAAERVLYVYDEVNEQSEPYIAHFRAALDAAGIAYDEVAAADLVSGKTAVNPAGYDRLLVHGMVMAFNSKSPVRDWLKKKPDLSGKKVSLLVTANRWFLDNLYGQLTALFKKDGAVLVDAVSMASKKTDDAQERAAVAAQVARFAGR